MAKYAAKFSQATLTTTFKTAGHVRTPAASMRRIKLYDVLFGAGGTPADNVLEFNLKRTTANGTDSAVTPVALDPADAAAVSTVGSNATVESASITANSDLLDFNLNQRATYRWIAAPGSELVIPNVLNSGIVVLVLSPAYTGAAGGAMLFEEQ